MAEPAWAETVAIPIGAVAVPLTPTALRLYILLAREVRGDSLRWPAWERLVTMFPAKTDARTVRRARSELIDFRLLELDDEGAWRLLAPPTPNSEPPPAVAVAESLPDPWSNSQPPEIGGVTESAWPSAEALAAMYNALVPAGHPKVTRLSRGRVIKAKRYLQTLPDRDWWAQAFSEIGMSAFLRGERPSPGHANFRADFDWLLSAGKDGTENIVKVAEGKYRDRVDELPQPALARPTLGARDGTLAGIASWAAAKPNA